MVHPESFNLPPLNPFHPDVIGRFVIWAQESLGLDDGQMTMSTDAALAAIKELDDLLENGNKLYVSGGSQADLKLYQESILRRFRSNYCTLVFKPGKEIPPVAVPDKQTNIGFNYDPPSQRWYAYIPEEYGEVGWDNISWLLAALGMILVLVHHKRAKYHLDKQGLKTKVDANGLPLQPPPFSYTDFKEARKKLELYNHESLSLLFVSAVEYALSYEPPSEASQSK